MYLIIVGAGKIGRNLIEMATGGGNDVVVIEEDEEVANAISSEFDCLVLNADATESHLLEEAGVDRADAVISTTNIDAVNTMVMLLAREHNSIPGKRRPRPSSYPYLRKYRCQHHRESTATHCGLPVSFSPLPWNSGFHAAE